MFLFRRKRKWNWKKPLPATSLKVGWLEFNVPFEHRYGYIRDENKPEGDQSNTSRKVVGSTSSEGFSSFADVWTLRPCIASLIRCHYVSVCPSKIANNVHERTWRQSVSKSRMHAYLLLYAVCRGRWPDPCKIIARLIRDVLTWLCLWRLINQDLERGVASCWYIVVDGNLADRAAGETEGSWQSVN